LIINGSKPENWGRTHSCLIKSIARSRTWIAGPVSETRRKYVLVGSGPASLRATVSETGPAIHVRNETLRQNATQPLRSSRWNISLWDSSGSHRGFPYFSSISRRLHCSMTLAVTPPWVSAGAQTGSPNLYDRIRVPPLPSFSSQAQGLR